ncbi:MAG: ABC transporter ATP-binding protein [Thermodesulfobacteriota bacterium]
MEDPFFSVEGLSLSFGGLSALADVSFSIGSGEIFSVIGPNGAGKTTLFNCINGLYKPDRGVIRFKGRNIAGKKPHAVARMGVARTFQNIELFARMTTMENLMLGRHVHMKTGLFRGAMLWGRRSFAGREEAAHRLAVEKIIDLLELTAARDKPVGALPYGTQKVIELGRALALSPSLLLLDEPCAGMNSEEREDMVFRIKDIQHELALTILLIEHDMKLVMDISDRVLALNFGRTITLGKPEEVREHPEVLAAYLGQSEA